MEFLRTLMRNIASFAGILLRRRRMILYAAAVLAAGMAVYSIAIYAAWIGDRDEALEKLSRYKKLIDRTEELHEGSSYSYSDVDLGAKVVDIPTRIYDRKGDIIGEFFEQKREIVPYDYIPHWLVKEVIASEDRDFYSHRGVSYRGIFRAVLANIASMSVVQGGSTITQQLAKVLFTDMERNFKRKVYEAFCAREIEKRYDKQDILSMYLNLIYFGNGAYGVEAASKMFFARSVRELNEVECAMIVATISSPKSYSPLSALDASVIKTRRILRSLEDAGYIAAGRAEYQMSAFLSKWDVKFDGEGRAVSSLIGSSIYSSYRINRAPFFNEQIRRVMIERFGEETLKKGGLQIYTTIDGRLQDIALECLRKGITAQRDYHRQRAAAHRNKKWAERELEKAGNIEGALVSLDPFTGEVLAYVGGSEFTVTNQNDNVSQIRRQPGSSIKPIIYAAAIEKGKINPSTVIVDEETEFEGGYVPKNYDGGHVGEIIAREALVRSINVVAVKVLQRAGYSRLFEIMCGALGVPESEIETRFGRTLSLALGAYEVSPMENCVLHAVLVSGGRAFEPFGIQSVKDYNGTMVWDNAAEVAKRVDKMRSGGRTVIDPRAAAVTVSMLTGVCEPGGTAYGAVAGRAIPFRVAGKTGTSADYVDAWFVGYAPNLVTAVWIGNKAGAISLGEGRAGGVVAAPVWGEYIERSYAGQGGLPSDFSFPADGLSRETICLDSGEVSGREGQCPRTAVQLFYSGTEPGVFCRLHVKPKGDKADDSDKESDNEN